MHSKLCPLDRQDQGYSSQPGVGEGGGEMPSLMAIFIDVHKGVL